MLLKFKKAIAVVVGLSALAIPTIASARDNDHRGYVRRDDHHWYERMHRWEEARRHEWREYRHHRR